MAVRDLSPSSWAAPGTARISLNVILSNMGFEPLPLDIFISNYAYAERRLVDYSSGFNARTLPSSTNSRGVIIIPPRGNTTAVTLKGVTGDTGLAQNPNGVILLTFPSSSPPASVGITTGGAITGMTEIWF